MKKQKLNAKIKKVEIMNKYKKRHAKVKAWYQPPYQHADTLNYEIVNSYPHLTITTANKLLLLFYNYNISFTWSIPLTDSSPMKKTWGSSFPFVDHEIDKRN